MSKISKINKKKYLWGLTASLVVVVMALGLIFLTGCSNKNSIGDETSNIENPIEDSNKIENPTENPIEDPTEDPTIDPVETHTEYEYKQMCEEKIENVIKDYFSNKYSKNLENFDLGVIDKTNGYVYANATVEGQGRFIKVDFEDKITSADSYETLYNNFKNATRQDVKEYKAEGNIFTQISSSLKNTFLDKVVTDQGFKDALAGVGVSIPFGTNNWEDVASVVNAKVIDNQSIEISFIDLNNQKTIKVKTVAYLTLQESTNVQSMVNNFNNKTRTYTIVESKDFSTFAEPVATQPPELGK